MKINDVFSIENDWSDEEIIISLESARRNLIKLKSRYPEKTSNIPDDIAKGESLLDKAKRIHDANKEASMMTVSIESYCSELNIDGDTKLLLESMVEES